MSDNFKTQIDISLIGDENGFPNGTGGRCEIEWKCEFDLGNSSKNPMEPQFFGIKGMIITVPDQKLVFESNFYDSDTDEEWEKEVTIDLSDITIEDDLGECTISGFCLLPVELEIHKGKAKLKFS